MAEKILEIETNTKARSLRIKKAHATGRIVGGSAHKELMKLSGFSSNNNLQLIEQIRKGIDVSYLDVLADNLSINIKEVIELVDISYRTLVRRKQEGKLRADESERVYRLADLMARATDVLHSDEEAKYWLKTPKKALGGETPLSLADTEIGAKEVKDLLGRIEHGVFS
tara:strand:- start:1440 stop:1946 length:507 start_codon:yes stop_codon:yes gene_type:complete